MHCLCMVTVKSLYDCLILSVFHVLGVNTDITKHKCTERQTVRPSTYIICSYSIIFYIFRKTFLFVYTLDYNSSKDVTFIFLVSHNDPETLEYTGNNSWRSRGFIMFVLLCRPVALTDFIDNWSLVH